MSVIRTLLLLLVLAGVCSAETIAVDDGWLAGRMPPYLLNVPGATYILQTDIDVPQTAFAVGADKVALDGNGHTITFGNSPPVDVVNGGFEEGNTADGAAIPGWDTSKAPAVIAKARIGMWGSQMLHLDFTTPQTLVSDTIHIPVIGREYAATITPKGSSGVVLLLEVLDAETSKVLAASVNANVSRGFGAVAFFTPSVTAVKLRVTLTPPEAKACSVDLDYAAVLPSGDYGVIASCSSTSQFPPHLKPTIVAANKKAANFTLRNCIIRQGTGRALGSLALHANSLKGLTVDRCQFYVNGMDSQHIDALSSANVRVTNSLFESDVDNIASRTKLNAAIRPWNVTGDLLIKGNTIRNCPQVGISVNNNLGGRVEIIDNDISQRAIVSNGYGIAIRGVNNARVMLNRIQTDNGRGIMLEAGGVPISLDIEIANNQIDVCEGPNLEYGPKSMEVLALRIRNYEQTLADVDIHHNTFVARTMAGKLNVAIGLRIMHENSDGQLDGANNLIEHNTFRAIVETDDPAYGAWAVSLSGVEAGTGLVFRRNSLESNDIALRIGDYESPRYVNAEIAFEHTRLVRYLQPNVTRLFSAIHAGDSHNGCRDIVLSDTEFVDCADTDLKFVGIEPKEITFAKSQVVVTQRVSQSGKDKPVVTAP